MIQLTVDRRMKFSFYRKTTPICIRSSIFLSRWRCRILYAAVAPIICHLEKRSPSDEYGFTWCSWTKHINYVSSGSCAENAGIETGQKIVGA
ncbi:hypothetical protein PFISCL1PPCAC_27760, partial [Pristionchus fissidentatus]